MMRRQEKEVKPEQWARDVKANRAGLMLGKPWGEKAGRSIASLREAAAGEGWEEWPLLSLTKDPPHPQNDACVEDSQRSQKNACVEEGRGAVCGGAWVSRIHSLGARPYWSQGRACSHGFLSSLRSVCFPGARPFPSREVRRPGSSSGASDGQAPGELGPVFPEFPSVWRRHRSAHLQGSGPL